MPRWLAFLLTVVVVSFLSAGLSGPLTAHRVLGQTIMLGGLLWPTYQASRRDTGWAGRCRLTGGR